MNPLLSVPLGDNQHVLVELDGADEGIVRAAKPGEVVGALGEAFGEALGRMRPMAEAIREQFNALPDRPQEVVIEFGLKVTAEAGIVVAHTSGDANFRIALQWKQ